VLLCIHFSVKDEGRTTFVSSHFALLVATLSNLHYLGNP